MWLSLDDHLLYLLNIYRGKIGEWFVENTKWSNISEMRGTNCTPHYFEFNQVLALKVHKYKKDFEHINHNQSPVIVGKL